MLLGHVKWVVDYKIRYLMMNIFNFYGRYRFFCKPNILMESLRGKEREQFSQPQLGKCAKVTAYN